ncbi:MAG: methyltransferase [Verrucomicrobia bacterium]|nr:methyltransferase [Cytophagales bacterium]
MDPSKIMQVGLGFWASKTLLAATKLQLFTLLGKEKSLTVEEVRQHLGLHGYALQDFLDALYAMDFLEREGIGETAQYKNTPETGFFLDKNQPAYMGGFFEMANDREYPFWATLEEGLRTGKPQNEIKDTGMESFTAIYQHSVREFTEAMTSIQSGSFMAFVEKFDFSKYHTMLDLGGSGAILSAFAASKHPHLHCISYDMPQVEFLAKETVEKFGLNGRVAIESGNFFTDDLPKADMITMGNILHSFDLEKKQMLIKKSYEALPVGGALCIIELIIDNERKNNTFALLMSLNMIIESDGGFNYTMNDFEKWTKEAGFRETTIFPLAGPASAAIAYK